MEKIKHQFRGPNTGVINHFKRHKQNYLFGMLGGFAIVKTFLFLFSFFGVINISGTYAQGLLALNSTNIQNYCDTSATGCDLQNKSIVSIAQNTFNGYTNLQDLYLSSNQLTEINLSGLSSLQELYLGGNQLTEINLDGLSSLQYLNLGGNKLTEIDLSGLSNLETLDLSINKLTEIDFDGLDNLERLDLGWNQLTEIDLSGLTGLQHLDLGNNELGGIDLSGLSGLKILHLSNSQLTEIDLSGLTGLETLSLGYNQLTGINLSGLTGLQYLSLLENRLTGINLSGLSGLQSLYLSRNKLTEIDLSGLSGLQSLDLGKNKLTEIDISGLSSLQKLTLYNNELTEINFSGLNNLEYLDLSNSQLTEIDFDGLSSLTHLYLEGNELTEIDLDGLSSLQRLDLGNNELTTIDLSSVPNLTSLDLEGNELTTIDLSSVPNLQRLDLGSNELTEINLSGLSNLIDFRLYNSQLIEIDLSGLSNLIDLRLYNNELTEIDLSGLSGLQSLDLGKNKLTEIDISGLSSLQSLDLSENQLTEIIGLTELGGIYYGNIGENHLPKRWIEANSGFFSNHGISYLPQTLSGCTNPTAYNYNPDARNSDNSCLSFTNVWTATGGTITKAYGSELTTGEIKNAISILDSEGVRYTGSFNITINGGLPNTMVSDNYRLNVTVVYPDTSTRNVIVTVILSSNIDNCCINGGLPGVNRECTDYSPSHYDKTCEKSRGHYSADICRVDQSEYSDELKSAYIYAYEYGITTMCPIQTSDLDGYLYRNHFAKMISEYAMNVLGKTPNVGKKGCDKFADISKYTKEMQDFMKTACELELMGMESDGKTPMKIFYPHGIVTRAEFGTVLSRLLYGDSYNINDNGKQDTGFWYRNHLQALQNAGIMTKIDGDWPQSLEKRGWAMVMFMRNSEK